MSHDVISLPLSANRDGIVSNLDDAMYIFSEDPAAPDTQR